MCEIVCGGVGCSVVVVGVVTCYVHLNPLKARLTKTPMWIGGWLRMAGAFCTLCTVNFAVTIGIAVHTVASLLIRSETPIRLPLIRGDHPRQVKLPPLSCRTCTETLVGHWRRSYWTLRACVTVRVTIVPACARLAQTLVCHSQSVSAETNLAAWSGVRTCSTVGTLGRVSRTVAVCRTLLAVAARPVCPGGAVTDRGVGRGWGSLWTLETTSSRVVETFSAAAWDERVVGITVAWRRGVITEVVIWPP